MTLTSRLFLILVLAALLAACGGQPAAPATEPPAAEPTAVPAEPDPTVAPESAAGAFTIVDGSGTELTFEKAPERIVCLYTRCTEVLATLGITPLAVAGWISDVAVDPDYFPQPNEIVILRETNDDLGFDPEEVAALKPDLVLGWEELRPALADIAPVHAVTNEMDSYQDSHEEIRAFAALFGREEQAETAIAAFLDRLEAYKKLSPHDRSVMNIWIGDGQVFYRDGQSGTCNLFKEVANCDWPDPTNESVWSVTTSVEGLLQLNPDLIVLDRVNFADDAAMQAEFDKEPLWKELTAYQNDGFIFVPEGLHNLDGMGTVGAARMLDKFMPLFYPDVFPAPLTDEEVQAALAQ